jgi:phage terminase large subunit
VGRWGRISDNAWTITIPTIREEGAEIWVTWNPDRKKSATHIRFREKPPTGSKIIQLNWRDNPFFPKILNTTRLDDLANRPDQYDWVWNGGFRTVVEGAYYAKAIVAAKEQGRITFVPRDPLMQVRAYFDIGGTGARADAVSIWIAQFIGQKINVLDYYEAQGRELSVHIDWMRRRGWGAAWVILPHDGAHGDKVFATSYESAIREAGFDVLVVPNQGQGAASARIETAGVSSRGSFSMPTPRWKGATLSPGTTKRGRTTIGTSGSGPATIGVLTPRTASGSCVFTTINQTPVRRRKNDTADGAVRAEAGGHGKAYRRYRLFLRPIICGRSRG